MANAFQDPSRSCCSDFIGYIDERLQKDRGPKGPQITVRSDEVKGKSKQPNMLNFFDLTLQAEDKIHALEAEIANAREEIEVMKEVNSISSVIQV